MDPSKDAKTIPIPDDVRALLDAPNYAHLSTLRADGSPRNHVVWVGVEGDRLLVCTSDWMWKAKDMRRNPRVGPLGGRSRQPVPDGRAAGPSRRGAPRRGLPLHGSDQ